MIKTTFKWIFWAIGLLIAYVFFESRSEIEKMGLVLVASGGWAVYSLMLQQDRDRKNANAAIEQLHERIRHLEGR